MGCTWTFLNREDWKERSASKHWTSWTRNSNRWLLSWPQRGHLEIIQLILQDLRKRNTPVIQVLETPSFEQNFVVKRLGHRKPSLALPGRLNPTKICSPLFKDQRVERVVKSTKLTQNVKQTKPWPRQCLTYVCTSHHARNACSNFKRSRTTRCCLWVEEIVREQMVER